MLWKLNESTLGHLPTVPATGATSIVPVKAAFGAVTLATLHGDIRAVFPHRLTFAAKPIPNVAGHNGIQHTGAAVIVGELVARRAKQHRVILVESPVIETDCSLRFRMDGSGRLVFGFGCCAGRRFYEAMRRSTGIPCWMRELAYCDCVRFFDKRAAATRTRHISTNTRNL